MKVKSIELKRFRRFHDLTINLGENPTKIVAMVGPNGSGKSSVFDAFEEKSKDYYGGQHDPAYASKSFYIPGELKSYSKNDAVKIQTDSSELGKTSFYIRTSYRYSSSIGIDAIKKLPSIIDEEHPASSIQLDSRLQKNYERLMGHFMEEVYGKDKTGKQWEEEQLGTINDILDKILDIRVSNLGNISDGKGQLWFKKGVSENFPYMNLSSGEKEVIDIVIDLIIKSKEYSNTVFCIDEPELHLNTAIQRTLLLEIEKMIPENCQLWIATHSLGFLRALEEDLKDKTSILDFSDKDFDQSVTLIPIAKTRNNWKKIFKTALEDAVGLLSPRKIIYCEGKKEPADDGSEQGIDAEIYNTIFEEEFPETLFVSSGGSTQPEIYSEIALVILNKAFSGVELVVLKDMDINGDGSPTTTAQRDSWLSESSKRKMLDRKEIENYLLDFEVVNKTYPLLLEGEFKKIIPDILSEDVKDKIGELMSACGIHTGMNKNDFLLKLSTFITKDTEIYKTLKQVMFD